MSTQNAAVEVVVEAAVLAIAARVGRNAETVAARLLEELCPLALTEPDGALKPEEVADFLLDATASAVSAILVRDAKAA